MITIENTEVYGWEAAVRGMRNPMNSWEQSDSQFTDCYDACADFRYTLETPEIGAKDLDLMSRLGNAGKDHGKFLRYLIVQLDIIAPFYWWKEFKTYRKGRKFMDDGDEILDPEEFEMFIETNSCSTMHKIHAKEFTLDDFSHEHLLSEYKDGLFINSKGSLCYLINHLNWMREMYLRTKDKAYWCQMIQLLPSGYNQRRTVQLNYQVLKSMYHARKNHKLDEWHTFCEWIEGLPYSELIKGGVKNETA